MLFLYMRLYVESLPIAWSPQAARTQDVAAAVMADWLDSSHWHPRSSAPQLVAEATASAIQSVAQAGICAFARPTRAMRATAENEYFILTVVFVMTGIAVNECWQIYAIGLDW